MGKSKWGLSKRGLSPKGANWAKKGPFGAISALPPWLWGAGELVPIGPEKAPTSPEMAPICPEKARFSRKDFPPIFSENLGLKPPFVSPPLDFPQPNLYYCWGPVLQMHALCILSADNWGDISLIRETFCLEAAIYLQACCRKAMGP